MSKNYVEFKAALENMQSSYRIAASVSASLSVAKNLPENVERNVPQLVSRVAKFKEILLTSDELTEVSNRVLRELSPA